MSICISVLNLGDLCADSSSAILAELSRRDFGLEEPMNRLVKNETKKSRILLVKLLQGATTHLRDHEIHPDDSDQAEGAVDKAYSTSKIARLILDERVYV